MAEIIKEWLNNQVELTKKITNFEKDFSNGFLFGELLYRFAQLPDVSKFQDKDEKDLKISNFLMILPVMRSLNVKFDTNIAERIIREDRGVALRLLYQLKMALEKVSAPTQYKMSKSYLLFLCKSAHKPKLNTEEEFVMSMPAQKIRPARLQYDKMNDKFFKSRLQRIVKPQKEVILEKKLSKFSKEQEKQEKRAAKEKEELLNKEKDAKALRRKGELNKLQRNAGFMDEWLEKGVKEWRQNLAKKKKREKEEAQFNLTQAQKILTKVTDMKATMRGGTFNEIQEFEKKVEEIELPEEEGKEVVDTKQLESAKKKTTQHYFHLDQGGDGPIKKESRYKTAAYSKEREQRRRKMLMDQVQTTGNKSNTERREDALLAKMNLLSRQEQELEYEAWRTTQCKNVIIENRKLREARYKKREELDLEVAMIREEEALNSLKGELAAECETEKERSEMYTVARKQYVRNSHAAFCEKFLSLIFDLADEAFKHEQISDAKTIDQRNWREWTQLFVEQLPMSANSPLTYSECQVAYSPRKLTDGSLEVANSKLDYCEFLDYIRGIYQWNMKAQAPDMGELVNNFELGNSMKALIEANYPPKAERDYPKLSVEVKLKLSIIGLAFSGKKTQAEMLRQRYGIAVIKVDELVEEAMKLLESKETNAEEGKVQPEKMTADEEELLVIAKTIEKTLLEGKIIPDQVYVALIKYGCGFFAIPKIGTN